MQISHVFKFNRKKVALDLAYGDTKGLNQKASILLLHYCCFVLTWNIKWTNLNKIKNTFEIVFLCHTAGGKKNHSYFFYGHIA